MTFECDGCCFPIKRKKEDWVSVTLRGQAPRVYHMACAPPQFRMEAKKE